MKPVSETGFIRTLRAGRRCQSAFAAATLLMTHFLSDILRQPAELRKVIDYLRDEGQPQLLEAAAIIRNAGYVYLTGIGGSWHAALCAGSLFHGGGRPVYMLDAAELLHSAAIPENAVIVAISRTGRSVEVVNLLAKARLCGAMVIAVTNAADSPLAMQSLIPIVVPVSFDHAISVNTYSSLAAAAGIVAATVASSLDDALAASLRLALREAESCLSRWQQQIAETAWLAPGKAYYFLARGCSLGSCHEARLLWEEGVKSPATAMGTSSFRHGPQEIVAEGMRFCMWIDGRNMREADLAIARDLMRLGASVTLIGQDLPEDAANLVFQLPPIPNDWQFLIDTIPAQLAAERLAGLAGVDCDSFRLCSYIVEDENGLLREKADVAKFVAKDSDWPGCPLPAPGPR